MSTATLAPGPISPTHGRDARGRFTKGNPGWPGNPFARKTALLRSLAVQCLSTADMQVIVERLIYYAREGHFQAIRLLFQYTLGKPIEGQHPDEVDFDETDDQEPPATKDALCNMLRLVEEEFEEKKRKDEQQREKRALARLAREKKKREAAEAAAISAGALEGTTAATPSPSVCSARSARQGVGSAARPSDSGVPTPGANPTPSTNGGKRPRPADPSPSTNGGKRSEVIRQPEPVDPIHRPEWYTTLMNRFEQIRAYLNEHQGGKRSPSEPPSTNGAKRPGISPGRCNGQGAQNHRL